VFGGSMYFDGTGDYLEIPANTIFDFGSSNFTIECWVFPRTTGVQTGFISNWQTTGQFNFRKTTANRLQFQYDPVSVAAVTLTGTTTTIVTGMWNHVAVVRNGSLYTLYVNGVADATTSTSAAALEVLGKPLRIGVDADLANPMNGYISDSRIIKGQALYTSNFVPQNIPLTPVTNTTMLVKGTNAGVYDSSVMNNLETVGDAKIDTTVVKFAGTNSVKFDGTGDYLVTPPSTTYAYLWTGNLTVECWLYFSSVANAPHIWSIGESNTARCTLYVLGNVLKFYTVVGAGDNRITSSTTLATGQWYHVAITKSNGVFTLWLNGVSQGTSNTTVFPSGLAETVAIGFQNYGGQSGDYFNGYISDFRITQGIARYTTNFIAPTAAYITK
jgi:hypothetical protein